MKCSPMTPQITQHSALIPTGGRYARKIKPPKPHCGSSPPTRPPAETCTRYARHYKRSKRGNPNEETELF